MKWWWIAGAVVAWTLLRESPEPAPSNPSPSKPPGGKPPKPPVKLPTKPPAKGDGPPILVIGDSLGVGLAPPLAQRHARVKGAAENGTTIDHWATTGDAFGRSPLSDALKTSPSSLVLISLGTNDVASGAPAESKRAKARAIVERIIEAGSLPVWILPPTLPTLSAANAAALRAVLLDELAARADVFDSAAVPFERAPDQIHATPQGYDQWAAAIVAHLGQRGLIETPATRALRRAGLGV